LEDTASDAELAERAQEGRHCHLEGVERQDAFAEALDEFGPTLRCRITGCWALRAWLP
jgi:hypothetical protein